MPALAWLCSDDIIFAVAFDGSNACGGDRPDLESCQRRAELGAPDAQYALADAYFNGWGAPENCPEAAAWYRRAAEQGHSGA